MIYKERSLFTKYSIEPNVSNADLMRLFQMDPNKRKDLPLVIQIIRDNKALLIEELFTKHSSDNMKVHNDILELSMSIKKDPVYDKIESFVNNLEEFMNNSNQFDFFYSRFIDKEDYNSLLSDFIKCIIEELYSSFILSLEKASSRTIELVISTFKKYDDSYLNKIEDYISTKIEFVISRLDENNLKDLLSFLNNIPEDFFSRDNVYKVYNFLFDKVLKENIDLLNSNYITIIRLFNSLVDRADKSKCIIDIINHYIDLGNENEYDFIYLKNNAEKLVDNFIYFLEINNFQEDVIKEPKKKLYLFFRIVGAGSDWWNDYQHRLEEVEKNASINSIYNLIVIITSTYFSKEELTFFSNPLIEKSGFLNELNRWKTSNDNIASFTSSQKINLVDYKVIKDTIGNKIFGPKECDEFLCKFYPIRRIDKDLFTDILIKNIKDSALVYIGFLKCCNDFYLNLPSGEYNLNNRGVFIRNVLRDVPSDWYIDNETIGSYLRQKFNSSSSYGVSSFSNYKSLYDELFDRMESLSKHNVLIEKVDASINDYNVYMIAKKHYKLGHYKDALAKFNKLGNYRDSKEFVKILNDKIDELQYGDAERLIREFNIKRDKKALKKAINIFEPLAERKYLDSEEKLQNLKKEYNNILIAEKKKKIKLSIIIAAVFLAILVSLIILVPKVVEANRKRMYTDLINYVDATDGNIYHYEIERIIDRLPIDYGESEEYENQYYYKRASYLIDNYNSSYEYEVYFLLEKLPYNYPEISSLKKKYEQAKLDAKYAEKYDLLLSLIKKYDGKSDTNTQINGCINYLPSEYKEVSNISYQFNNIKSYCSTIDSIKYDDNMTNAKGDTVRTALKRIASIDSSSSLWDCSLYYKSLDIRKVVFGATWVNGSTFFKWYSDSDGPHLYYNIPTNKDSGKNYYFYDGDYSSYNQSVCFYLENQKNEYDSFAIFTVSNLYLYDSNLAVKVHINYNGYNYIFVLSD